MTLWDPETSGGTGAGFDGSASQYQGIQLTVGNAMIGDPLTSLTWSMKYTGGGNTEIPFHIRNSSGSVQETGTSLYTGNLSSSFTDETITFPGAHTLAQDDCITMSGQIEGQLYIQKCPNAVLTQWRKVQGSLPSGSPASTVSDYIQNTTAIHGAAPSSGGTRLPPHPIVLGGL